MREILFKAKRKDNGEWIEGYLFKTEEHTYIAYARQFNDDLFFATSNIFIVVDENTVCQYTGLKDMNGKKIWENDIILYHWRDEKGVVKFGKYLTEDFEEISKLGFYISWEKKYQMLRKDICLYLDGYNEIEVIGNIFDNSELLERGAK